MKIASAYNLFITSLCVLPSAHAAVRGRSLVRGVAAPSSQHRLLQDDPKDGEESKGGKKESPLAPKKRDCKLRQEGENEVAFKCRAKSDDENTKIRDEIDYTVGTSEKGVMVKIKYEQEINVDDEEKGASGDKPEKGDKGKEGEGPPEDGELDEPPSDEEIAEPPVDGETTESPPVDGGETVDPPVEGETVDTPVEGEISDPPVEGETVPPFEEGTPSPSVEGVPSEGRRAKETKQETKTQFEVIYDSIIEYTKGEGSTTGEAYDWENDVVLQTISLNTWDVMSEIDSNNQTSSFSVTSPDGTTTFTFTLNQAAIGESASANKMKIDFELNNFPWTSDESFVALLSTVETERKDGPEMRAAENVLVSFDDVANTTSFTPFGEYSWAATAEATPSEGSSDPTSTTPNATTSETATESNATMTTRSANITSTPQTITVVATSPLVERADRRAQEGKQVQSIAYSFVGGDAAHRASNIYWDPSAGVDYQSSARPLSLAVAGAGIFFTLIALL